MQCENPGLLNWGIICLTKYWNRSSKVDSTLEQLIRRKTCSMTRSPGTISFARTFWMPDLSWRTTLPISGSYSLRASMADSALRSCHTPTTALAIRISKITRGSTNAVNVSSCSSNRARTWGLQIEKRRVGIVVRFRGGFLSDNRDWTYKWDDGCQQQNLHKQIVELLQDQLPDALSCGIQWLLW